MILLLISKTISSAIYSALNEESARRGMPDTKFNPRLMMEYWGPCEERNERKFNFGAHRS